MKGKNEEIKSQYKAKDSFCISHYEDIKKQKKLACEQDLGAKNFTYYFFKAKANQVKKKADKSCEDFESLPYLNVPRMRIYSIPYQTKFNFPSDSSCCCCTTQQSLFTKCFYSINQIKCHPITDENSDYTA
ncbi:hypothetical protein ABPG72_010857 [Tetrahymena utriculariae]